MKNAITYLILVFLISIQTVAADSDRPGYTLEELHKLKKEVGDLYLFSPKELRDRKVALMDELNTSDEKIMNKQREQLNRLSLAYNSHPDNPFSLYVPCPVPDIKQFKLSGATKFTIEQLIETDIGEDIIETIGKSTLKSLEEGTWKHVKVRSKEGNSGVDAWAIDGELWVKIVTRSEVEEWGLEPGRLSMSDQQMCEYPRLLKDLEGGTKFHEM